MIKKLGTKPSIAPKRQSVSAALNAHLNGVQSYGARNYPSRPGEYIVAITDLGMRQDEMGPSIDVSVMVIEAAKNSIEDPHPPGTPLEIVLKPGDNTAFGIKKKIAMQFLYALNGVTDQSSVSHEELFNSIGQMIEDEQGNAYPETLAFGKRLTMFAQRKKTKADKDIVACTFGPIEETEAEIAETAAALR